MERVKGSDVAVLGAGIVGVCTALSLLRDGRSVTLIDRDPPGTGCSFGNAGLIQTGACVPIATPGVLRQVPKMLSDPDGPLVIRWRHLHALLPYLLSFAASARPARVEEISKALAELLRHAEAAYRVLLGDSGSRRLLRKTGELYVYEHPGSYLAAKPFHDLRRRRGVEVVDLDPAELRQLEPALAPIFSRGVLLPDSVMTASPYAVTSALAEQFVREGGRLVRAEVQDVAVEGGSGGITLTADAGTLRADRLVIAAGAFSKRWAAQLACRLPLDSERGYHLMLPAPGIGLRVPVLSGDHRFGVAPMMDGIRIAGTAELARVGAPPMFARAERLLALARRMLPGLGEEGMTRWMGHRPSTPDSLPVIGRSPRYASVFLAFGHGHLGLTLGAFTGRLISDLVAERPPVIELRPYLIERFQVGRGRVLRSATRFRSSSQSLDQNPSRGTGSEARPA